MKKKKVSACKMIAEAVLDENKGGKFYSRLSTKLKMKAMKRTAAEIGKQEGRHKKILKQMQKKIC